jgi:hypothetical protein
MNPSPARPARKRPALSPSLIDARVRQAFARLPYLLAFSFDADLAIADVEVNPCPGCDWGDELYEAVDVEIAALVDELENQDAAELLRGRTFARTLH